jgi:hypothetical protein
MQRSIDDLTAKLAHQLAELEMILQKSHAASREILNERGTDNWLRERIAAQDKQIFDSTIEMIKIELNTPDSKAVTKHILNKPYADLNADESSIVNYLSQNPELMSIAIGAMDDDAVIKKMLQKSLVRLSYLELIALKHHVTGINVRPMLESPVTDIYKLGQLIHFLQGDDFLRIGMIEEIADASTLIQLYSHARGALAADESPAPSPREGSPRVGSPRESLRDSLKSSFETKSPRFSKKESQKGSPRGLRESQRTSSRSNLRDSQKSTSTTRLRSLSLSSAITRPRSTSSPRLRLNFTNLIEEASPMLYRLLEENVVLRERIHTPTTPRTPKSPK